MYARVLLALLGSSCILQVLADSDEMASKEFDINHDLESIDATDSTQVQAKFEEFKKHFNRNYENPEEEQMRLQVFKDNLVKIQEMNSNPEDTATYGINDFTDLTNEEMKRRTGFKRPTQ